jgi:hypothetical protein
MRLPEPYLWPKELAHELHAQRGLEMKVDRIYAIRLQSEALRDGTFLDGRATVSGLMEWLREHPDFVQRPAAVRSCRRVSVSVL